MRFATQLAIGAFAFAAICAFVVLVKALRVLGRDIPSIDEEETHG